MHMTRTHPFKSNALNGNLWLQLDSPEKRRIMTLFNEDKTEKGIWILAVCSSTVLEQCSDEILKPTTYWPPSLPSWLEFVHRSLLQPGVIKANIPGIWKRHFYLTFSVTVLLGFLTSILILVKCVTQLYTPLSALELSALDAWKEIIWKSLDL